MLCWNSPTHCHESPEPCHPGSTPLTNSSLNKTPQIPLTSTKQHPGKVLSLSVNLGFPFLAITLNMQSIKLVSFCNVNYFQIRSLLTLYVCIALKESIIRSFFFTVKSHFFSQTYRGPSLWILILVYYCFLICWCDPHVLPAFTLGQQQSGGGAEPSGCDQDTPPVWSQLISVTQVSLFTQYIRLTGLPTSPQDSVNVTEVCQMTC